MSASTEKNPPSVTPAVLSRRNGRSTLTVEERKLINPFRKRYEEEYNRDTRIQMLRYEIVPVVINYWRDVKKKKDPKLESKFLRRVKLVSTFVRNNWRRPRPLNVNSKGKITIREVDLVRELFPAKWKAEMMVLAGSTTEVSTKNPRYISWLNTAVSKVRNNLTAEEEARIQTVKRERETMGHPPELQAKLYEKVGDTRVKQAAASHYLEMGMLNVSFTATRGKDGLWITEFHDHLAEHVGVTAKELAKLWPEQVADFKAKLLQYVRHLHDIKDPNAPNKALHLVPRYDLQITKDAAGYPIMPAAPPADVLQSVKEQQKLVREYLNTHYQFATGYRYKSVPFKDVAANVNQFIDKKYLPPNFLFREPSDMRHHELVAFMKVVRERQGNHSIKDAFRFKAYADRQGNIIGAKYDRSHAAEKTRKASGAQKLRRADKKAKAKEKKENAKRQKSEVEDAHSASDADPLNLAGMQLVDGIIDSNIETPPPNTPPIRTKQSKRLSPAGMIPSNTLATPPDTPAEKRPRPRPAYKKSSLTVESPSLRSRTIPDPTDAMPTLPTDTLPTTPDFELIRIDEATYNAIRACDKTLNLAPTKDPNTGKLFYEILPALYKEYQAQFKSQPLASPQKGRSKASDALLREEAVRVGAHLVGSRLRTTRSQAWHK